MLAVPGAGGLVPLETGRLPDGTELEEGAIGGGDVVADTGTAATLGGFAEGCAGDGSCFVALDTSGLGASCFGCAPANSALGTVRGCTGTSGLASGIGGSEGGEGGEGSFATGFAMDWGSVGGGDSGRLPSIRTISPGGSRT